MSTIQRFKTILWQASRRVAYSIGPNASPGLSSNEIVAKPGDYILDNEQVRLLKVQWSASSAEEKAAFEDKLSTLCDVDTAGTLVHALVELQRWSALLDLAGRVVTAEPQFYAVWEALRSKLSTEPHLFSPTNLQAIRRLANTTHMEYHPSGVGARGPSVGAIIDRIEYLRLRDELLETVNPELNADRAIVVERARSAGFSEELPKALAEVEARIAAAASGFDFKACMELTRTALQEFVRQTCRTIEPTFGKPVPGATESYYKPWLDYLSSAGLLRADEQPVFQSLYNYMSKEGAHKLGSAVEAVRVARGVTIELLLLLSGRLQGYLGKPPAGP
jgi:hypothetical protein